MDSNRGKIEKMEKANYIGTVPLKFLDESTSNWSAFATEDIFETGIVRKPSFYITTLGSGVASHMTSLATSSNFRLPTNSQFYLAGRDVLRWAGTADPYDFDIDHYGFTPDYNRKAAIVWMSPKSVPHHLSQRYDLLNKLNPDLRLLCEAVLKKQLP